MPARRGWYPLYHKLYSSAALDASGCWCCRGGENKKARKIRGRFVRKHDCIYRACYPSIRKQESVFRTRYCLIPTRSRAFPTRIRGISSRGCAFPTRYCCIPSGDCGVPNRHCVLSTRPCSVPYHNYDLTTRPCSVPNHDCDSTTHPHFSAPFIRFVPISRKLNPPFPNAAVTKCGLLR